MFEQGYCNITFNITKLQFSICIYMWRRNFTATLFYKVSKLELFHVMAMLLQLSFQCYQTDLVYLWLWDNVAETFNIIIKSQYFKNI